MPLFSAPSSCPGLGDSEGLDHTRCAGGSTQDSPDSLCPWSQGPSHVRAHTCLLPPAAGPSPRAAEVYRFPAEQTVSAHRAASAHPKPDPSPAWRFSLDPRPVDAMTKVRFAVVTLLTTSCLWFLSEELPHNNAIIAKQPLFRPGSGTAGLLDDTSSAKDGDTKVRTDSELMTSTSSRRLTVMKVEHLSLVKNCLGCVSVVMILALMYHEGRGHHRYDPKLHSGARKPPPSWSPEWRDYPLRQWVKDVSSWIVLTDYQQHQLGTVIRDALQGSAAVMAREYSQIELIRGRTLNTGYVQDPVTMIFSDLQVKFGPRVEEDQQQIDQEMETFERKPGERFETMLLRHEILRARQRDEGMQQFSFRHHALTLLRFSGLPDYHYHEILLRRNNRIPETERELNTLIAELKDRTRLMEQSYGNPMCWIYDQPRHRREHRYLAIEEETRKGPLQEAFLSNATVGGPSNTWGGACGFRWDEAAPSPSYLARPPQSHESVNAPQEEPDEVMVYMVGELYEDGESSSATSSDHGTEDDGEPQGANETELAYFRYRRAKRMWRQQTGRPTRRFRRAYRIFKHDKYKRYENGQGRRYKPTFNRYYHQQLSQASPAEQSEFLAFLASKGKGGRKGSGKGFGRRGNPKDKNGNVMTCRICGSTEHFQAKCPNRVTGAPPPQLYNASCGSAAWSSVGFGNGYRSSSSCASSSNNGGFVSMFVNNVPQDGASDSASQQRMTTGAGCADAGGLMPSSATQQGYAPRELPGPRDSMQTQWSWNTPSEQQRPSDTMFSSHFMVSQASDSSSSLQSPRGPPQTFSPGGGSSRQQPSVGRVPSHAGSDAWAQAFQGTTRTTPQQDKDTYTFPDDMRAAKVEAELPNYLDLHANAKLAGAQRPDHREASGPKPIGTEKAVMEACQLVQEVLKYQKHRTTYPRPAFLDTKGIKDIPMHAVHRIDTIVQNRAREEELKKQMVTGTGSTLYPQRQPKPTPVQTLEETMQACQQVHAMNRVQHLSWAAPQGNPFYDTAPMMGYPWDRNQQPAIVHMPQMPHDVPHYNTMGHGAPYAVPTPAAPAAYVPTSFTEATPDGGWMSWNWREDTTRQQAAGSGTTGYVAASHPPAAQQQQPIAPSQCLHQPIPPMYQMAQQPGGGWNVPTGRWEADPWQQQWLPATPTACPQPPPPKAKAPVYVAPDPATRAAPDWYAMDVDQATGGPEGKSAAAPQESFPCPQYSLATPPATPRGMGQQSGHQSFATEGPTSTGEDHATHLGHLPPTPYFNAEATSRSPSSRSSSTKRGAGCQRVGNELGEDMSPKLKKDEDSLAGCSPPRLSPAPAEMRGAATDMTPTAQTTPTAPPPVSATGGGQGTVSDSGKTDHCAQQCPLCQANLGGGMDRTVQLTCGCRYHNRCWGHRRHQQYHAFQQHVQQYDDNTLLDMTKDYSRGLTTYHFLTCPTCRDGAREAYYTTAEGTSESWHEHPVVWAPHTNRDYPSNHFDQGVLGQDTQKMDPIAACTLNRLVEEGKLVVIRTGDDARGNVSSTAALDQAVTADLSEAAAADGRQHNGSNGSRAASSAPTSRDARSPSELTTHDSASVVNFQPNGRPPSWPTPPASRRPLDHSNGSIIDTASSRTTHYTAWEHTFTCGRAHAQCTYHVNTRPEDGKIALLIDPGSVGNLCGDKWARELAALSAKHGQDPQFRRRKQPLQVAGVGAGSQKCINDYILPVALQSDNMKPSVGSVYRAPAVQNSDLPGLLGLASMRDLRVVLDLNTLTMHFCGPGDYDLSKHLPPGTDSYPLEVAPSGHLLLPCSNFEHLPPNSAPVLTLLSTDKADAPEVGAKTDKDEPEANRNVAAKTVSAGCADSGGMKPPVPTPGTPPPKDPPTASVLHNTIPEVPKGTP